MLFEAVKAGTGVVRMKEGTIVDGRQALSKMVSTEARQVAISRKRAEGEIAARESVSGGHNDSDGGWEISV